MRAEKDQTCSQTIRKRRYSTEIKEGYIRLFLRSYFEDEKPLMGFKKACLIARKKVFLTLTLFITLAIFAFAYYMFWPIMLVVGYGIIAFIEVSTADRFYSQLYREEQDRIKKETDDR